MTTEINTLATSHPLIGRRVLVRSSQAGVYSGTLLGVSARGECHLVDGNHYWSWTATTRPGDEPAIALCGMARNGGTGKTDSFSEIVLDSCTAIIVVADGVKL